MIDVRKVDSEPLDVIELPGRRYALRRDGPHPIVDMVKHEDQGRQVLNHRLIARRIIVRPPLVILIDAASEKECVHMVAAQKPLRVFPQLRDMMVQLRDMTAHLLHVRLALEPVRPPHVRR